MASKTVAEAQRRLLEAADAKRTAIRDALIEGEESGPSTTFDVEAFMARKRNETPGTNLQFTG